MPTSKDVDSYFGNTISSDVLWTLTGAVIGSGQARIVYECPLRPDLVVKIETGACSFQNVLEHETWENVEHIPHLAKWFAPVELISACGSVLLQKRTTIIPPGRHPARIPSYLTDHKRTNYGMLDGRVVCHDYGYVLREYDKRLRKVEWWD